MIVYNKNGLFLYKEDIQHNLRTLNAECVDVVVTSPPYNFAKKYATYKDNRTDEEYLNWMEDYAKDLKHCLKPNGSIFLNMGNRPIDPCRAIDVANRFRLHWTLQNTIIWAKAVSITKPDGETVSAGHYKPLNTNRFLNDCWEYIFHFTPSGVTPINRLALGVPYTDKNNIKRWKSGAGSPQSNAVAGGGAKSDAATAASPAEQFANRSDLRDRGNIWFIPYETIQTSRPHPAVFPIQLPTWCIKLHGYNADTTVLDPFMGIGSTAVAAKRLGIKCIGFDIEDDYLKQAAENVEAIASTTG